MGRGAAGRWQDAASGQHGDLLDIIRERCGLSGFREVAEEARRFLGLACDEELLAPNAASWFWRGGSVELPIRK